MPTLLNEDQRRMKASFDMTMIVNENREIEELCFVGEMNRDL